MSPLDRPTPGRPARAAAHSRLRRAPGVVRPLAVVSLWATLVFASPVSAQTDQTASVERLIERAEFWTQRNRLDLARPEWERVLEIVPDEPRALAALIVDDARNGRLREAREGLARLRQRRPDYPDLADLEIQVEFAESAERFEHAARLSDEGRYDDAVAAYREALGDRAPPASIAPAYIGALAQTRGGRAAALESLAGWIERGEGPTRLYRALAGQLLTFEPESRLDGVAQLARIVDERRDDAAGRLALDAWRQALIWEDGNARARSAMREYLARQDDAEIRRLLNRAEQAAAPPRPTREQIRAQRRGEAFRLLDRGQAQQAEARFRALLDDDPDSVADLEGLASAQLAGGNPREAIATLDRAIALSNGAQRARLEGLRRDAELALDFRTADRARAAGDRGAALLAYTAILERDPNNVDARLARAGLYQDAGELPAALADLDRVAALRRDDETLLRRRVDLLMALERHDDAWRLLQSLPSAQRERLRNDPAWLLREADLARQRGDAVTARQLVDRALRQPLPRDAASLLQLGWLAHDADPGSVRVGEILERLAQSRLDASQTQERRELERVHLAAQADRLVRAGQLEEARTLIRRARASRPDDAELASIERRLDLSIAWRRLEAGDFSRLYSALMALYHDPGLDAAQAEELRELFRAGASQEALPYRRRGDLAAVAAIYRNMLRLYPDDPVFTRTLAGVYQEAGQNDDAWALYARSGPDRDDPESYRAVIAAAAAAGRINEAVRLRDEALERHPRYAPLWQQAGELEEQRGRRRSAIAYYERAIALMTPEAPTAPALAPGADRGEWTSVAAPSAAPVFAGGTR